MTNAATADLTALADDLARASGIGIYQAGQQLVAQGATIVQAQARSYAPKRTGFLAQSITVSFPDPLTAVIGPTARYGVFQEYGTRGPYIIRSKRPGGVLVFTVNGRRVVARQVTHPGIPAHPFMRPAAQDAVDQLSAGLGDAGVRLVMG